MLRETTELALQQFGIPFSVSHGHLSSGCYVYTSLLSDIDLGIPSRDPNSSEGLAKCRNGRDGGREKWMSIEQQEISKVFVLIKSLVAAFNIHGVFLLLCSQYRSNGLTHFQPKRIKKREREKEWRQRSCFYTNGQSSIILLAKKEK
jgi:hypothetical protein